jgi:hypothetical protein
MPLLLLGCTKAIRVPWAPLRGFSVDHAGAVGYHLGDGSGAVVHFIGQVMHAAAVLFQELGDGAVGAEVGSSSSILDSPISEHGYAYFLFGNSSSMPAKGMARLSR